MNGPDVPTRIAGIDAHAFLHHAAWVFLKGGARAFRLRQWCWLHGVAVRGPEPGQTLPTMRLRHALEHIVIKGTITI